LSRAGFRTYICGVTRTALRNRESAVLRIALLSAVLAAFLSAPADVQKKKGGEIKDNEISLTSFSVPIVRRGRIKGYEFAKITMKLADLKHGPTICDKRFHLADEFLLVLHDHPIEQKKKKEQRTEAEGRLRKVVDTILGPGIVSEMKIAWSRRTSGTRSIFGVYTDILCKTGAKG